MHGALDRGIGLDARDERQRARRRARGVSVFTGSRGSFTREHRDPVAAHAQARRRRRRAPARRRPRSIRPLQRSCIHLQNDRRAEAAGGARRDERVPSAAPLQLAQHGGDHARPRRRERMADGDRAAVHVELRVVDLADRPRSRPSFSSANSSEAKAFRLQSTCAANASCMSMTSMSFERQPGAVERHRASRRLGPMSIQPPGRARRRPMTCR